MARDPDKVSSPTEEKRERERTNPNPGSLPFLPPAEKKKKEDVWATKENHPVPIDHREDGNLSRPPREACVSILTLETRAPSKERREEWFRVREKPPRERAPMHPAL